MNTAIGSIWAIVVAFALLAIVLVWEFRYQTSTGRWIRIICWMVALAGLNLLYWQPEFKTRANEREAVIFTEGISEFERDSILQTDAFVEVSDPYGLKNVPYDIRTLHVHGFGLKPEELKSLKEYAINFHATPLPYGITEIFMPEAFAGVPFRIEGVLSSNSGLELILKDPEGNTSRQQVPQGQSEFTFETVASSAGLFDLNFYGLHDSDTVFHEVLPFHVKTNPRSHVLMIGSFPSFELKTLKNHLSDLGFGVASRFRLSREIFHAEFRNMERMAIGKINEQLIREFKLLVMDDQTWQNLSEAIRRTVLLAVESGDLGLFLAVNDLSAIETFGRIRYESQKTELSVSTSGKQLALSALPYKIADPNWTNIEFQKMDIGSFRQYGLGKIGFGLATNSYILELQGAGTEYAVFWDNLLSPVMGFDLQSTRFHHVQFPFVNDQLDVSFDYSGIPEVEINGNPVPVTNSPIRLDFWTGTYWPFRKGWHNIQIEQGDEKYHFFAHAQTEWRALYLSRLKKYNEIFAESSEYKGTSERSIDKPLSKWYGFTTFLLAMSGLWLERKFH